MCADKNTPANRRLEIISFTETGTALNERLCTELSFCNCRGYAVERFAHGVQPLPANMKGWLETQWGQNDLLFIGAVGIAVRMIAPFIKDKYTDPAILCMDENGRYVIPLLSGHVGGAVELAKSIAECIGAQPVITTATDVQSKFAVDVFTRQRHLAITDRNLAKNISAAVLEGKQIGFYAETDCESWLADPGALQRFEELRICREYGELRQYEYGIAVVQKPGKKEANILYLVRQNIVVGIGCRKGTPRSVLEQGVTEALAEHNMGWQQIGAVVSIDLKAEEPALVEMCREHRLPFLTYPAEKLKEAGPVSSRSEFVEQVTGVDNVCERAVKCYLQEKGTGIIIQEKRRMEGMTIAIGEWK